MPRLPTIRICYNVFLRWHGKDAGALAFGRHPGSGASFSSCVGSCVKAHRAEVASIAGRHQPACGNSSLSLRPGRNLKQKSWNDSGFAKQIPAGTGAWPLKGSPELLQGCCLNSCLFLDLCGDNTICRRTTQETDESES